MEMEMEDGCINQLPPGFRFCPTDEELVLHFLYPKALLLPCLPNIIPQLDRHLLHPWELDVNGSYGEGEWYFFTPRDKKYRNGSRPRRAAGDGYWKATGADRTLKSSKGAEIGYRKALVFYRGKPPKGVKTDWMMHEYRLKDPPARLNASIHDMRLDDWVLCKIYKKSDKYMKAPNEQQQDVGVENEDELDSAMVVQSQSSSEHRSVEEAKNSLLPQQGLMHFKGEHSGNMNGPAADASCYDDCFMPLGQDSTFFMDNHSDFIIQQELAFPSFSSSLLSIRPLENLDQFINNIHEEDIKRVGCNTSSEFLGHHYP
ncbi:hypothetical protein DITRI_Ditri16bG0083000 [Diplodiscus trichospermus]